MRWEVLLVDALFVIFGALAVYHGYKRGLIGQAIWFFSALLGFVLAARWAGDAAEMLSYRFINKPITIAICFVAIFMISLWLLYLIGAWITKSLKMSVLGTVNSLAGAIFSLLLYMVSVTFVVGLALIAVPKASDYFEKTIVLKRVMQVNKAILDKAVLEKIRKRDLERELKEI